MRPDIEIHPPVPTHSRVRQRLQYKKAFNTINHRLLISKCHYSGFDNISCEFLKSYLSNRLQRVIINNQISNVQYQKVFSSSFFFADDIQLYNLFKGNAYQTAVSQINLEALSIYSCTHNRRLNPTKSIVMIFGDRVFRKDLKIKFIVKIDNEVITFSQFLDNLGLYFEDFRFYEHLQHIIHQCYCQLSVRK